MAPPRLAVARLAIAALLGFSLVAAPARAKEPVYTMRPGDTVERVARHYYGVAWKAVYILGRNHLAKSSDAVPGTKLVIPGSWTYTVHRGDTLARIAKKYLGDSDRFEVLARNNHLRSAELEVGAELLMPFHVTYVVQKGDSYSAISRRFYRSSHKAQQLIAYNGNDRDLDPGDRVTVPIFDRVTLEARKKGPPPPPKTAAAEAEDEDEPEKAVPIPEADMRAALDAYHSGDFRDARDLLEGLLPGPRLQVTNQPGIQFHIIQGRLQVNGEFHLPTAAQSIYYLAA